MGMWAVLGSVTGGYGSRKFSQDYPSGGASCIDHRSRIADCGPTLSAGAGCRVPGAGCRVPGAGCRVPGAGCRARGDGRENVSGRNYLSYVREDLIALWKVHAVLGEPGRTEPLSPERAEWTRRAQLLHASLRDRPDAGVWPWAFQLGRTRTAASLEKGDVIWVVARLGGLGRRWPPALVARMTLAEDAWVGPAQRCDRKDLPFPYHFGVAVLARSGGGRFFPANDATRALIECRYQTPPQIVPDLISLPDTADAHVAAWAAASGNAFRSLRRLLDPAPLERLVERLRTHSVFLSYRWADHPEGSVERAGLRDLAEALMVRERVGVWLDALTLPPSRHDREHRRAVIEQLLLTPLRETPLLVAHVTTDYGGPSAELGPDRPGYTLLEWCTAKRVLAWEHLPSRHANRLGQRGEPCHRCPSTDPIDRVARDIDDCLSTSAA